MNIFTNKLRTLVSQDRNRHEEGDLNIDLTYITDRILAMGFPAAGFEATWRNNIEDVCKLLSTKHKDSFLIFNLSERNYQYELFGNQIVCFPFKDHHAPPLHIIFQIVFNIDSWLRANDQNVAVVHCIGGKGRTGLIIVCYLFYNGLHLDMDKCLEHFAERRSAKGKGVTQPSQLRYVRYFCGVMSGKLHISPRPLKLSSLSVGPIPKGFYVYIEFHRQVYVEQKAVDGDDELANLIFTTYLPPESRLLTEDNRFFTEVNVELNDDILVRAYILGIKEKEPKSKTKIFRMQFHAGLIHRGQVVVSKTQLDDINKDKKKYPADFDLRMNLSDVDSQRNSESYNAIFHHMKTIYNATVLNRTKSPPLQTSVSTSSLRSSPSLSSLRSSTLQTPSPLSSSSSSVEEEEKKEETTSTTPRSVEWQQYNTLPRVAGSRAHRSSVAGAHKVMKDEQQQIQELLETLEGRFSIIGKRQSILYKQGPAGPS